jgi:hypothetical protein
MPSNDDVLVQILAAIKAGGGGTVAQGAPQTDATKPWYVKLLSGGVDIGAQIAAALAGILPYDLGGGVKALPTASHAVGPDVIAPGAAFPAAAQVVQPCEDAAGKAQPIFQGSGTMAQAARVTLATDGPGVADLDACAIFSPLAARINVQNTAVGDAAMCTLKAGGTYQIAVKKNVADLTLTTAAYLGFGAAAVAGGATTMLRTSDDGDLYVNPLADVVLHILWVGSACPVQVVGGNALALVA